MSTTSFYQVFKTKASCIKKYPNGHGSGPAIWDYIALKLTGRSLPMFDCDWFWPLWKDHRLSDEERAVLLSTYDYAIIEPEHIKEFGKSCIKVHSLIIAISDWDWNHFKEIGMTALQMSNKIDKRCIGFGIGCTSVSDPWMSWPIKDKGWYVYESIQSLKSESKTSEGR